MPKLLSQSKHEEFKSNSTLQIRSQKESGVENRRKRAKTKISHDWEICFLRALFIMQHCSPFCHYSPFLLFDVVTFLLQFFVSSHFIPCNSFWFCFVFFYFPCFGQYISLSQALYKSITSCDKFLAGKLSRLPLFFFCFTFSHFLSIFWAAKHPSRMTTQRMNG